MPASAGIYTDVMVSPTNEWHVKNVKYVVKLYLGDAFGLHLAYYVLVNEYLVDGKPATPMDEVNVSARPPWMNL